MAKQPHIDEAFKNAFEHFEAPPSDGVWSAIQDNLFDQSFVQAFDQFETPPADGLFNQISDQLVHDPISEPDFDATFQQSMDRLEVTPDASNWEAIQKYLPLSLLLKRFLTVSTSAAILVVLTGILAYWIGSQDVFSGKEENNAPTEEQANLGANPTALLLPKAENPGETPEENSNTFPENDPPTSLDNSNNRIFQSQSIEQTENRSNTNSEATNLSSTFVVKQSSVEVERVIVPFLEESEEPKETVRILSEGRTEEQVFLGIKLPVNEIDLPISPKEKTAVEDWILDLPTTFMGPRSQERLLQTRDKSAQRESLLFKGAYFSFNSQFLASWVQNQSIKNRLADGATLSGSPYWSATYGAGLGVQLKPRLALEFGWTNARVGQGYQNQSTLENSELRGTYNYFPLSVRYTMYRLPWTQKVPITINLVGGIHYGRLESAVLMTGVEGISFEDKVIQNELGLHGGMDYLFHFDPNFFLSFGPRMYVGTEAERLIGQSNANTTNIQLGLNLGIHYRIKTQ